MANSEAGNDFAEHEKTYNRFMKLVKYSIVGMVIGVVILYVLINP